MIDWNGCGRTEERRFTAYIKNPAEIDTVERCQYYDKSTARYMDELRRELEEMQAYRAELFARMQTLYTAPYHLRLTLSREPPNYRSNKVFYFLQLEKVYEDSGIKPETISSTKYAGAERAKAIADFQAEKKNRPGIEAIEDTQRRGWEK